ncbi:MAG: peptidoglycan-binding LysM [Rhodobacteraceae bacterium]|nr:MAG: peptidoglycan-binding LysM [Paracoccaceae bacterium]
MAGTAGSGGLGALAIGGIATAAVVIGSVVAMQFGVFEGEPPVADLSVTTGQVAPAVIAGASVGVEPDAVVVTEPATTNAQAGDEGQIAASTGFAETSTSDQPAETVAVEVAETTEPGKAEKDVPSDAATDQNSLDEAAGAVATKDNPAKTVETVTQEPAEQGIASPVEDTAEGAVDSVMEEASEGAAAQGDGLESQAGIVTSGEEANVVEQPEPTVTAAVVQPNPAAPKPTEEPAFILAAPELDLVRFDTDGAGVVAGRAQAGVLVSVLLDGTVLDQFRVQDGGEFVSFISIEPSAEARVMSLRATFDGQVVMADATFILAPSVAVAAVENEDEQPPEVVVALADVTPNPSQPRPVVQQDSVAVSDAPGTGESAAVGEMATSDGGAATDAEAGAAVVASVSEGSVDTAAVDADAAQTKDQPVVVANTAVAVAQPAVENVPQPQPSPVAMAVLKADSEGVELVQSANPVAPELLGKVSLDIISYSDEGDVQLAGRARPVSLVRVYLDNSPVADIRAAEDGRWKAQLSDVVPGIYTLRLDELDAEGKVLSRLETPFKRESPDVLQPPVSAEESPAQPAPPIRAATVQKGDTLWAISRERYGDGLLYVRVFEANKGAIRDPDLIYPGQIFSIPE